METELFKKIVNYLTENNVAFELFEHEPVYTSSTASKVSYHLEEEGTKSLALSTEKGIVIVTVSGAERIDFKLIKKALNVKKIKMCDIKSIERVLKTEIGGLAPFGYGHDIELIVSQNLFTQNSVYFNPGRNDATIKVSGKVFATIMGSENAKVI